MNVADSTEQRPTELHKLTGEGLNNYNPSNYLQIPLQSPVDGVCRTAGFVQHSQNVAKPTKTPSNVRFTVQPVPDRELITSSTTSFSNEDHNTISEPSDVAFSYRDDNMSSDDLTGNYSKLFFTFIF